MTKPARDFAPEEGLAAGLLSYNCMWPMAKAGFTPTCAFGDDGYAPEGRIRAAPIFLL
jgi:hypothetical protein